MDMVWNRDKSIRPTEVNIEQWLQDCGRSPEAYAGLAWMCQRIALRRLDDLGNWFEEHPGENAWRENAVKHVFSLGRALLVNHLISGVSWKTIRVFIAASSASASASAASAASAAYAADPDAAAYAADPDASSSAAYAANTASYAAYAAYAAFYAAADVYATGVDTSAASDAADSAASDTDAAFDFSFLWQYQSEWLNEWTASPELHCLYLDKKTRNSEPHRYFFRYIAELGLDFLAEDLQKIYNFHENPVQSIPKTDIARWQRYFDHTLSETVLGNASALRQIIAGNGEMAAHQQVRILLVGPGGAGKTTLSKLLRHQPLEPRHEPTTVGMGARVPLTEYWKEAAPGAASPLLLPDDLLRPFLWDFGGQVIFQQLHHLFYSEQVVYVVVVDSRHEQDVEPWLWQIRHVLKDEGQRKKARVFVLTNQQENCFGSQNQSCLLSRFGDLLHEKSFVDLNLWQTELSPYREIFMKFQQDLVQACRDVCRNLLPQWVAGIEKLRSYLATGKEFVTYDELKDELSGVLPSKSPAHEQDFDDLLGVLIQLGYLTRTSTEWDSSSVSESQRKTQSYFLSPDKVSAHAYQLMQYAQSNGRDGMLKNNDIGNLPEVEKYFFEQAGHTLQQYGVCNEIKGVWFFHNAAKRDWPEVLVQRHQEMKQQKKKLVSVRWMLDYMPIDLYSKMVGTYLKPKFLNKVFPSGNIQKVENIWRGGFLLHYHMEDSDDFIEVSFSSPSAKGGEVNMTILGDAVKAHNALFHFDNALTEYTGITTPHSLFFSFSSKQIVDSGKTLLNFDKEEFQKVMTQIINHGGQVNLASGSAVMNAQMIVNNQTGLSEQERAAINQLIEKIYVTEEYSPADLKKISAVLSESDEGKIPESGKSVWKKMRNFVADKIAGKAVEAVFDGLLGFIKENGPALMTMGASLMR
jgi:GTPase SAR1 family protein